MNKPFHDVRVRQAMMLATDFESIVVDYFEGEAEIDVWPVNKQTTSMYKPINELPESVQELYSYNPEKARQLLKEAGYPNGFKAKVVTLNVPQRTDELSIFVDQWAKVGIELELDVRDTGVYNGINAARSHEDLVYRFLWGTFVQQLYLSGLRGISGYNPSFVSDPSKGTVDPVIEEIFHAVNDNIFVDNNKAYEEYKRLKAYVLEQAYYIVRPTPWTYSFWWPWLNNSFGQGAGFVRYYWIDQKLKQSMGY
jgi:peptide/nickel transport system substrate-binding protein